MLLQYGLDPNETDGFGLTALHQSSQDGHVEITRVLLDASADLRAKCFDNLDALTGAVRFGHADGLSLLLERGISANDCVSGRVIALQCAAERAHADVVKVYLDAGADIQATNVDGMNALDKAAMGGHASTVKLLLDRDAVPDTGTVMAAGRSTRRGLHAGLKRHESTSFSTEMSRWTPEH